ncbi:MAG: NADH-quinone oxidoreductase subunit N [Ardenticatenaceae bacterium]|nr:NADH-quinone oxidoreductase subunit N [Ardenticatenaceae bacterium]
MEFQAPAINIAIILPVVIVAGFGLVLMILDMLMEDELRGLGPWISLGGLVLAGLQTIALWLGGSYETFIPVGGHPMVVVDGYAHFFNMLFIITGILAILMSMPYLIKADIDEKAEYYMLLMFSISGMMLMGMANDLLLIFIGLELLSIPLYVMCGIARPREASEESAMKYFLLGAFASGFLVFGLALLYGATGSTALPVVVENFTAGGVIAYTGLAMQLVGLAFKVGAVPFHMWTPDVYEGAPTAVTAFMSVGAKVGGFAAMIRILAEAVPQESAPIWTTAIAIIAAATLILGNVVAISQTNIKRMLAYSSIAHGGYILMAVAALPFSGDAVSASLTYMLTYMFTNLGAFAVIMMVEKSGNRGVLLEDYKGLSKRNLGMALILAYFMFSLIGMPLTGGFIGKFVVFQAAIDANLIWLTIIGVVTAAVSAYYYLRVVFYMFMFDGQGDLEFSPAMMTATTVALVATLAIGFFPGLWLNLARTASLASQLLMAGG